MADIVGSLCETGDFLARYRELASARAGDLLAVLAAGAYGYVLASNYNSRPRPAEVLVRAGTAELIRRRESLEDLMAGGERPSPPPAPRGTPPPRPRRKKPPAKGRPPPRPEKTPPPKKKYRSQT